MRHAARNFGNRCCHLFGTGSDRFGKFQGVGRNINTVCRALIKVGDVGFNLGEVAIDHLFEVKQKFGLFGDVGGELDHLDRFSDRVENRVVACLDPDFTTALADALELAGLEFALIKVLPEGLVFGRFAIVALDKHRVMLAADFIHTVAHHRQEVFIGLENMPLKVKLDHGLGCADGFEHALQKGTFVTAFGNIAGKFDDLEDLALVIKDRVIGRFKPQKLTVLAFAREGAAGKFARAKFFPEPLIFGRAHDFFGHEHGVMLTNDFFERVAHHILEIVIGPQDVSLCIEFNARHRATQCCRDLFLGQCMLVVTFEDTETHFTRPSALPRRMSWAPLARPFRRAIP